MANTISSRAAIFVQFNIDTNPVAGAPSVTLLCNRDYAVVDYNLLVVAIAGGGGNATISATDIAPVPVTSTIGFVTGVGAGIYTRPTQSTNAAANAFLSGAAIATVVRGGRLTITSADASDFVSGYITVLPGNRYSAVTTQTSYYANNAASGNSSASISI